MPDTGLARHLDRLRSSGPPFFSDMSVSEALGTPPETFRADIADLVDAGDAVCPHQGFYVLAKDGRPGLDADPTRWLQGFMAFLGIRYRVSLLSAAAHFYGASHQAIMCTQAIVPTDVKDIRTGYATVLFLRQKPRMFAKVNGEPWVVRRRNGLVAASPELTIFDLVDFARSHPSETWHIGQTVKDMGDMARPDRLRELARCFLVPVVRRLGYLLDHAGLKPQADALIDFIRPGARHVRLNPRVKEIPGLRQNYELDEKWGIVLNDHLEYDI
ncbi:MAG: type IV toxin-antitoxin system AbiEi family antitoxin [Desulfovibrio sp.]|jgi:hypothetical protein|nr:type IV toxin-antitoxin system AbiEi family antitoxin [Desulfovibrio sp.]